MRVCNTFRKRLACLERMHVSDVCDLESVHMSALPPLLLHNPTVLSTCPSWRVPL